ncbi:MAG: hypothetical protein ACTSYH_03430 [Candidatus Heimdallarchaeaceae archaeon]
MSWVIDPIRALPWLSRGVYGKEPNESATSRELASILRLYAVESINSGSIRFSSALLKSGIDFDLFKNEISSSLKKLSVSSMKR